MQKQIHDFKRNYYTSDDSGKIYILALLFVNLLALVVSFILGGIGANLNLTSAEIQNALWYKIPSTLIAPIAYAGVFICFNKYKKISFSATDFKVKVGWKNALLSVFIGAIMLFGLQYLIGGVDYLLSILNFNLQEELILPLDNLGWFVLNIIVLALLPALFEELIFRGVVFKGLRSSMSDTCAILLSALLFALMHGNLQQFVYQFLLGCVIAWMFLRTGSSFCGFIVHFTNNFLVILMNFLLGTSKVGALQWWEILLAVLLPLVVAGIILLVDRFYFKSKEVAAEESKKQPVSLFVWLSIAVGIILLIISIVMNYLGS